MKKIVVLLLSFVMIFSLAACSKNNGQSAVGSGNKDDGEMVWTVKSVKYTYSSGYSYICYTGELKDSSFSMNKFRELRQGETDRSSMIFEFDSNGITKYREEAQDYGEEVEIGDETTLVYDDATSTLTRTSVKDGKVTSKYVYVITWDDQERISAYVRTNYYYYYNDDGSVSEENKYEYKYTYKYGTDSFTITYDLDETVSIGNDRVDAIKRTVSTIPYAEKGDIETVISYFKTDGTTPINVGWNDPKSVNETMVSNWWGYIKSHVTNYDDGSKEDYIEGKYTFDAEGKIIKVAKEGTKGGIILDGAESEKIKITTDFTYDENGNLKKIVYDYDGTVTVLEFEWMKIPATLDNSLAMLSGSPHWSVAEYIDNYVDFNSNGSLTDRTYKKSDFLSYVK